MKTDNDPVTLTKTEDVENVTANGAELIAILKALRRMKEKCEITLYTDSSYVSSAINSNWLTEWQQNGWLNAKKQPIANQEEWQEMAKLLNGHVLSVEYNQAHEYGKWMKSQVERKE